MDGFIRQICKVCLNRVVAFGDEIIVIEGKYYMQCPHCMNLIEIKK